LTGASATARGPAIYADGIILLAIAWAARQSVIVGVYAAVAFLHFCLAPILLARSGQPENTDPPWLVVVWVVAIAAGASFMSRVESPHVDTVDIRRPSLADKLLASGVVGIQIYLVSSGRLGFGAQLATGLTTPTGWLGDISTAAPCMVLLLLVRLLSSGRRYDTWTYLLLVIECLALIATGFRGSGINFAVSVAVGLLVFLRDRIHRIGLFRGLTLAIAASVAIVVIFNATASVKHNAAVNAQMSSQGTDIWTSGTLMFNLGTRLNLVDPLEAGVAYSESHAIGDLGWGTQLATVVPRALFPNKQTSNWGQSVTSEVFGQPKTKSSSTISTLGDIYLNGGYAGVVIIGLLLGYGLSRLEGRLRRGNLSSAMAAAGALVLFTMMNHEVAAGLILVDSLQSFLIIWALSGVAVVLSELHKGVAVSAGDDG
jgi:hypothetical protein